MAYYLVVASVAAFFLLRRAWRALAVSSTTKNLAGPASSWLTGNLTQLNDPDELDFHYGIVRDYGGAAKVHGFLGDEQIYFSDPLALRHIIVTEVSIFRETAVFTELNRLTFGDAMTTVHDAEHRRQRKLLNSVFSATQMRALVPIIHDISTQLADVIERKIHNGEARIDIWDLSYRTAVESLGCAGLGYPFHSLDESKSKSDAYSNAVKSFFPTVIKLGPLLALLPVFAKIGTAPFRRRIVELIPWKTVQTIKDLIDTMDYYSYEVLENRKAAMVFGEEVLTAKVGSEKDIIALLLRANESASIADRLSEKEIVAQINLLLFAASDSTSVALSRAFEQLARCPDVQDRLRKEIVEATSDHEALSYNELNELKFLHAVAKETLRLYPPIVKFERIASQDVIVPLHIPVKGSDGQMISKIHVSKNQNIIIGIANCNRDTRLWGSDATEWKPQRWLEPLPQSLLEAHIPGVSPNLMTFLGGDRSCIGHNLALMEMKVVLLKLVSRFRFTLSDSRVEWKLGFTQYPVIPGEGLQLPLTVSHVK